jgi:hypothetical protein
VIDSCEEVQRAIDAALEEAGYLKGSNTIEAVTNNAGKASLTERVTATIPRASVVQSDSTDK